MIRVEVEVCAVCLGPTSGGDPEGCPGCDDGQVTLLRVEGSGGWSPGSPGRSYGPPEHCSPPEPGEYTGDVAGVVRVDTGEALPWAALPDPTQELALELLADEAEQAYAEDDSAECADEDRADARREDGY